MESIKYLGSLIYGFSIIISSGIAARCLQIVIQALLDGDDFGNAIKKIRKKIFALICAICVPELMSVFKHYWPWV